MDVKLKYHTHENWILGKGGKRREVILQCTDL